YIVVLIALTFVLYFVAIRLKTRPLIALAVCLLFIVWPDRWDVNFKDLGTMQVAFENTGAIVALLEAISVLLALYRSPYAWAAAGALVSTSAFIKPQGLLLVAILSLWLATRPELPGTVKRQLGL